MKKLILLLSLIFLPFAVVNAQNDSRRVSIIPHAGVAFSKLDGDAISYGKKWKAGFTAGAEVEIPVANSVSIATGADYSLLGTGLDVDNDYKGEAYTAHTDNAKINVGYISVPVQIKYYANKSLAFHIGVEASFKLFATEHATTTGIKVMDIGDGQASTLLWESYKQKDSEDVGKYFRNFIWDIPVGLSYEYKNIVLSATYRFEVRKSIHINNYEGLFNTYDGASTARHHAILVTLGYRFRL